MHTCATLKDCGWLPQAVIPFVDLLVLLPAATCFVRATSGGYCQRQDHICGEDQSKLTAHSPQLHTKGEEICRQKSKQVTDGAPHSHDAESYFLRLGKQYSSNSCR